MKISFLPVEKRDPKPENCDCPNCKKRLLLPELLQKKCNECGATFKTNIHDEPIECIIISNGKKKSIRYTYQSEDERKYLEVKEEEYPQNLHCPHCSHNLNSTEVKFKYCYGCNNRFSIDMHGNPYILIIEKDELPQCHR